MIAIWLIFLLLSLPNPDLPKFLTDLLSWLSSSAVKALENQKWHAKHGLVNFKTSMQHATLIRASQHPYIANKSLLQRIYSLQHLFIPAYGTKK